MTTKNKPTIAERIEAMTDRHKAERLRMFIRCLKNEFICAELLTNPETVALAKKLLCRGLRTELTKAEVEAFLRG